MSASDLLMDQGSLLPVLTETNTTSRRDFVRAACAPALLAMLGISFSACDSATGPEDDNDPGTGGGNTSDGITVSGNTITLDLTKSGAAPLAATGGFLRISSAQVLAVNVNGTVRAFSSVCPHQGNTVSAFDGVRFTCPTHGSQFDTTGKVVNGPATSNLTEYAAVRSGNTVTITKT